MDIISYDLFSSIEIRSGTIIKVEKNEKARKIAYKVWVDFGSIIGILQTSVQICENYTIEQLLHKQICGCINLGTKNIAGFESQFLLLGFPDNNKNVVIITPNKHVPNGEKLL